MINHEYIEKEIAGIKNKRTLCRETLNDLAMLLIAKNFMEDDEEATMSEQEALQWVLGMQDENGNNAGEHWSIAQTTDAMHSFGFHDDPVEYYAAMNMMHSDYGETSIKLGVPEDAFCAEMAHAFLHDPDAQKGKITRYRMYIAK